MLAALQVSLAGWLVLVKLSSSADLRYSSKLGLGLGYALAEGRALPGAAGVAWLGASPAAGQFSGKDGGWDFPQNSGTMETAAGDLLLPLPPNLS